MAAGDHLWVWRPGYTHHGIEIEDGQVIHYAGLADGLRAGPVEIVDRVRFAGGREIQVRSYRQPYDRAATVARARSRLGEACYSVTGMNCEHFAVWCVTGRHASRQVKLGASAATGTQVAVAGAGTAMAVSSAGTVAGLSGPGLMSGLVAIGPGGAVGGLATLAGGAGMGAALVVNNTLLATNKALAEHEPEEHVARRAGQVASVVGAGGATAGGVAAVSAAGTVSGLSGAGIMSGLAAIGAKVGLSGVTGAALGGAIAVAAAPVVVAVGGGYAAYRGVRAVGRWRVRRAEQRQAREQEQSQQEEEHQGRGCQEQDRQDQVHTTVPEGAAPPPAEPGD